MTRSRIELSRGLAGRVLIMTDSEETHVVILGLYLCEKPALLWQVP